MVVCTHERRGWLDATRTANELAIDTIWATADGAIDRAPGSATRAARVLPAELELGAMRLARVRNVDGPLHASWRGSPVALALGPTMPPALPQTPPGANVYVGSLPEPDREGIWTTMLTAAHAAGAMSLASGRPRDGIQIILLGDAVGTKLRRHTHLLPGLGITMVGVECPVAPSAIAMLGAALTGAWDAVEQWTPMDVEDAMEQLIVDDRLDAARALVDRALAARDVPHVHRLDATLQALTGDRAAALAALERAESDPFSSVLLAALRAAEGDHEAAEAAARLAHEINPGEVEARAMLARSLWLAGRVDEARELLDHAPAFSLSGTQAADLYALIDQPVPSTPPFGIAHLASRALAEARRAPDHERARRAARRALALDPCCAPARELLAGLGET
jgi:tetratricopeptide (TPR) repeat protein